MWTEAQLTADLRAIGLMEGASVLAHTSLRAIGAIKGGGETLVRAFRQVLGPSGTLLVPTFCYGHSDPAGWHEPPRTPDEREAMRAQIPLFDPATTPTEVRWIGMFPELVRKQPDAQRSHHPVVSFATIGANAEYLTQHAPFHYPLGTGSPLARLHQLDGYVLLIGVGHKVNSTLHLAEIWADVPYVHRSLTLKVGREEGESHWSVMRGSPECSSGFSKIEPMLRHSHLLREGTIGNAPSQLIRQRTLVSMAVAMLQGDGAALLCDDSACRWCPTARKLTAASHA